ncbi:LysM peptidoglycan-binding domain-containing protein [Thermoflavimicrobium dichotomicum]|uniref:Stage VI sporulation protein D n=1 Tax=Thermoflavimicrobium dichotomicum TaxID=46223 RepID=A0A1I3R874_9BACL|nr:LysM peptidoglycan-binding domain-containing protein [Thermoflavimicrobium dichotomicum]SFJ42315.1 stage VI sporulation protein D [Thermoflavimicrobium dichotomicum]
MVEQEFQQLRFDISEKVRLHPQQPGIGTLLELDLYPDVEIKEEGQHLKIQGYLRLNGFYLGDDFKPEVHISDMEEVEREEIAYVIPVEITLPSDRAELKHISAEIESFDYSVLSPFEMKIEAMLVIDGLLPEPEKEADELQTNEPAFYAEPAQVAFHYEEPNEEEFQEADEEERITYSPIEESSEPVQAQQEEKEENIRQSKEQTSEKERKDHLVSPARANTQEDDQSIPNSLDKESTQAADEPKDLAEPHLEEESLDEVQAEEQQGPEWVRWLVRSREETFKPMRMVIVQKNESVDYLADRFKISTEKLIKANQLQSDYIEEGEILYIPISPQVEARDS